MSSYLLSICLYSHSYDNVDSRLVLDVRSFIFAMALELRRIIGTSAIPRKVQTKLLRNDRKVRTELSENRRKSAEPIGPEIPNKRVRLEASHLISIKATSVSVSKDISIANSFAITFWRNSS